MRSAWLCAVHHRYTCYAAHSRRALKIYITRCTWSLADCKATFPETYTPVANRAARVSCSRAVFARALLAYVKPCRRALRFHAPTYIFILLRKVWRGYGGIETPHPTQGLVVSEYGSTAV
jgi:hypothetical protein